MAFDRHYGCGAEVPAAAPATKGGTDVVREAGQSGYRPVDGVIRNE